MREIDKLKQRMKNVSKNVSEYRMTIPEAYELIQDFDDLEKEIEHLKHQSPVIVPAQDGMTATRILDGGTFLSR